MASFKEQAEKARKALSSFKRKNEEGQIVQQAITVAETGGSAAIMSYVNGRFGEANERGTKEVAAFGVPVDIAAGLLLHGTGFYLSNKDSYHLHSVGNGLMASYFARTFQRIGEEAATEASSGRAGVRGMYTPGYVGRGGLPPQRAGARMDAAWHHPAAAYP